MYSLAAPLDSTLGVASSVASKNVSGDDLLRALSPTHGGSFVGPHLTSIFQTSFVSLHSRTAVAGDLTEL